MSKHRPRLHRPHGGEEMRLGGELLQVEATEASDSPRAAVGVHHEHLDEDRASPKKHSPEIAFNRRTLYRTSHKISMSSSRLASPIILGLALSRAPHEHRHRQPELAHALYVGQLLRVRAFELRTYKKVFWVWKSQQTSRSLPVFPTQYVGVLQRRASRTTGRRATSAIRRDDPGKANISCGNTSKYPVSVGPFDFRRLGLRSPAMLISPWVTKGSVIQAPRGPSASSTPSS